MMSSESSPSSQDQEDSICDDDENSSEEKEESPRNLDFNERLGFVESKNVKNTARPKLQNKEKTRDIYEMTGKPRGYCVIVANYEFKKMPKLSGYSKDLKNLKKVFSQLYFEVKEFHNQTGRQIEDVFREFANIKPTNKEPNAFVGIVLSHGRNDAICGVNDDPDDPYHPDQTSADSLVSILNNANCPLLQHKPKMLFIQACRGDKEDSGAQNLSMVSTEKSESGKSDKTGRKFPPTPATPLKLVETDERNGNSSTNLRCHNLPLSTDTIVCFSALNGFVSYVYRHGSVFGVALARMLILHAHNMDLNRILGKVMREIAEEETKVLNESTTTGEYVERKQAVEVRNLSFHNQLFFNPGQPREIKQKSRKSKVSSSSHIPGSSSKINPDKTELKNNSKERVRKNLSSLLGDENIQLNPDLPNPQLNSQPSSNVIEEEPESHWLRKHQDSAKKRHSTTKKSSKRKKSNEAQENQTKISKYFQPENKSA